MVASARHVRRVAAARVQEPGEDESEGDADSGASEEEDHFFASSGFTRYCRKRSSAIVAMSMALVTAA